MIFYTIVPDTVVLASVFRHGYEKHDTPYGKGLLAIPKLQDVVTVIQSDKFRENYIIIKNRQLVADGTFFIEKGIKHIFLSNVENVKPTYFSTDIGHSFKPFTLFQDWQEVLLSLIELGYKVREKNDFAIVHNSNSTFFLKQIGEKYEIRRFYINAHKNHLGPLNTTKTKQGVLQFFSMTLEKKNA